MKERYVRNTSALTPEECEELLRKRVLVVGCGGLGGYSIELLARVGIGSLCVVDGDCFTESNLNRQLLCTEGTIGLNKAQAALERVKEVNSSLKVSAYASHLTGNNAADYVRGCDCALDALDSPLARRILRNACRVEGIPLVHGAIAGWFGQVGVTLPDDEEDIFSDVNAGNPQDATGIEKELGNLGCSAATVAALQVAEAIKILLGRPNTLHKKLLMIDLATSSFETVDFN